MTTSRRRYIAAIGSVAGVSGCLRLTDEQSTAGETQPKTTQTGSTEFSAGLYAFDTESGEQTWVHKTDPNGDETRIEHVTTSPDRLFYTANASGSGTDQNLVVRALDKETSEVLWEQRFEEGFLTGIHYFDGALLLCKTFNTYLLNPDTGIIRDELPVSAGFGGFLSNGERVYLLNEEAGCYNMATERFVWRDSLDVSPTSLPILRDGTIYYGGEKGFVVAIDAADATQVWSARVGGLGRRVAVGNYAVWVVDEASRFYGFSRTDGSKLYTRDRGIDESRGWPVAVDGLVSVPNTEGPNVHSVAYSENDTIELTPEWDGDCAFTNDGQFIGASGRLSILDRDGSVTWESDPIAEQHTLYPATEHNIQFQDQFVFAGANWDG